MLVNNRELKVIIGQTTSDLQIHFHNLRFQNRKQKLPKPSNNRKFNKK